MAYRILLLLSLVYPAISFSAIQILATRVVFDAKENDQSFVIRNKGKSPSLIQIWLSKEDNAGMKIDDDIPMLITPPVARINPGKDKVFRLLPTAEVVSLLPQDRESVFWISALDVPAAEDDADENKLNIAFRTRIKTFYRPAALKGDLIESAENMRWRVVKNNNSYIYTVTNNSPFHISFASMTLKSGEKDIASLPGNMVSPWSEKEFVFKNISNSLASLNYQYITDLGAYVSKKLEI